MPNEAKTEIVETAKSASEGGYSKVIPIEPRGEFGRFKPTIHWYTPILMILAAAIVMGGLAWLLRKLGRKAEARRWDEASRSQAYADRPFRTGPPESVE